MIRQKASASRSRRCVLFRRVGLSTMAVLALASPFAVPCAEAANYALIMTIGEYANPAARLSGIDIDARKAVTIAEAMGVSRRNIQQLSDRQLSADGIRQAIARLASRVGRGDGVFLYYPGHGTQTAGAPGKCSEGLLAYDMEIYGASELVAIDEY